MGFSEAVKRNPTDESAAIIAVDSGIRLELESFNDEDLGTISPEEVEGCLWTREKSKTRKNRRQGFLSLMAILSSKSFFMD